MKYMCKNLVWLFFYVACRTKRLNCGLLIIMVNIGKNGGPVSQ